MAFSDASTTVTASTTVATDHLTNPAHPLFLHPGENPALILVNPPLSDTNYQQWQHNMLVALETKNKDKFVLGTISCPPPTDVLHEGCKRCNKMVISWLTRSMTLPIKQSVMWMDSAPRFGMIFSNAFLTAINSASLISNKLSNLANKIQQERNDDSVIKFLRGLNDEFSQVRSQIMLMEPMPTLPKTFSLILQQEREFHHSSPQNHQDSITNVHFQDPQNKTFSTSRGRTTKFGGRAKYNDHCKRTNHTSDNCWIKYGLPQGYKPNIRTDSATSNSSAHMTDGVSLPPLTPLLMPVTPQFLEGYRKF
ncbi:hypothetical protein V8G54_036180 [Vigna mungo]|uniref:Retrotransposon Copia-like N-terminal domain-containing protein n=1 Tax=Vigna mungo TaxID=3915 RepID=A0AAQ3MGT8_VIGMU